ncbi:MAG: hypothetical protein AVDCRST_MAG95-2396 [uncultured Adhaeribacter sp.]|uniref:Uncharacterized protein n=1 Tax=uncultured Adhaeribacter sp. TaxID=448109 RepID=A0A6J4J057_9BACT|nr:MAG: hypothetical protein AVDCRST_MAG95-2396 [uncultured Adhaeribacter sp.]
MAQIKQALSGFIRAYLPEKSGSIFLKPFFINLTLTQESGLPFNHKANYLT